MRQDFRSTDLAGARAVAGIFCDGLDPDGSTEYDFDMDEAEALNPDPGVAALFEEIFGSPMAVADLPF